MPIKHYGIYLAYAPGLDLRHEGLGRYLAAFVKGAEEREDVRFVLVCPSWSREGLEALFESEGVSKDKLEVVSPATKPIVLRMYEAYLEKKKTKKKSRLRQWFKHTVEGVKLGLMDHLEQRLVSTHSYLGIALALVEGLIALAVAIALSPLLFLAACIFVLTRTGRIYRRLVRPLHRYTSRFSGAVGEPKDDAFVLRLYKRMEKVESERMLHLIDHMNHVRAWYSPTAFWPAFNKIKAPRLMCVPDVVLSDFPVGFSRVGGGSFHANI